jgi:hypothetical protein
MLASRIASIEAQNRYSAPRSSKFQKSGNVAIYDDYSPSEEVAAVKWAWKQTKFKPWLKASEKIINNKYTFDITKADKIFDLLLEKVHIKLTAGHKIPSAEELKRRRYCKYHDTSTHHTNECKVFQDCIQRAIDQGKIGLDKNKKTMDIEDHPFPQNMIAATLSSGKVKVLTSEKAKESNSVDPDPQMTAEEYREVQRRRYRQNSRFNRAETSKAGAVRRRPTAWILLNKWQCQQDKDHQRWLKEDKVQQDEGRNKRKQDESHWGCPFFRYCWNEGLKLPTRNNCLKCNNQGYR